MTDLTGQIGTCQWFALCRNEANGLVSHPVLNLVPTCQRCADKLDLVFADVESIEEVTS